MPKSVAIQEVYPEFKKIAVQVKNVPELKDLYKLRDIAVKSGSDGAIILRFKNRLYAPESGYEQDYAELEKQFELQNNDALVVAFSADRRNAELGAYAIAAELSSFLKKFINEF